MRKVLVVDHRRSFQDNLRMQLIVNGTEDLYRVSAYNPSSPEDLKAYLSGKMFDFVLIEHEELESHCTPDCFGGLKLYGYSVSRETPSRFDSFQIPYMGQAADSGDVLRIIEEIYDGKVPETVPALDSAEKSPESGSVSRKIPEKTPVPGPVPAVLPEAPPEKPTRPEPPKHTLPQDSIREPHADPPLRGNLIREKQLRQAEELYERQDSGIPDNSKTRTVTVWSAKGGVGKSTVAANLALYLSMIPHGRGVYRVCLADYNIESGDIRTILGFKGEHLPDMSLWAEEIHQQLSRGRRPENITFSQARIAEYLQPYNPKTGLSVLLAPELHEKAQFIETEEIQVMLDNLIRFGGFDFIICDTADNTSDSSFCALEKADQVLMICTQDVTCANRNDSVLRSLKRSGIDTSKFRIILNSVASRRKSGVSAAEVEEFFNEYECIGRIRENGDVMHANNYSKPLVCKPRNDFREDLEKVVRFLLSGNDKPGKKKKGLFSR